MKICRLVSITVLLVSSMWSAALSQSSTVRPERDSLQSSINRLVNEFSMKSVEKTAVGYQYWFVGKEMADGKTLKMSVVKPHSAAHAPHVHAEEEFFFVLEGKVEFYLKGQRKIVTPYASFYCPPNSEHGIRNVGDTEAKYLVIKKYEKSK